jgi:peptidoglycan-associated lipoprotein
MTSLQIARVLLCGAGCWFLAGCAMKEREPSRSVAPVAMRSQASRPTAAAEALSPRIIPGTLQDFRTNVGDRVFFAFDRSDLDNSARTTLQRQAVWLERYPAVRITVQGNCDERGTREYNLALGARRASAAREYLITLGVAPQRISTISFGKERPACAESTESCWAKNRRAVSALTNLPPSPNIAMTQ